MTETIIANIDLVIDKNPWIYYLYSEKQKPLSRGTLKSIIKDILERTNIYRDYTPWINSWKKSSKDLSLVKRYLEKVKKGKKRKF